MKHVNHIFIAIFVILVLITVYVLGKPQSFRQYASSPRDLCGDNKCSVLEDMISCPKDCDYNEATQYSSISSSTGNTSETPTPTISL